VTTEVAPPPAATPPPSGPYSVRLSVGRAESASRLLNFPLFIGTFIREVLLIPHLIVLAFLGFIVFVVYFIATFAILFTGKFPAGMHNFVAGYMRWSANLSAYLLGLVDAYPPFSMDQKDYQVVFQADYPEKSSRILNFPLFGMYIKYLLLIPHLFVLAALGLIAYVVLFIAQFAVLFTGQFPEGMHKFLVGVSRWSTRVNAYVFALTDRYPPFSLD